MLELNEIVIALESDDDDTSRCRTAANRQSFEPVKRHHRPSIFASIAHAIVTQPAYHYDKGSEL